MNKISILTKGWVAVRVPRRRENDHKGTYGKVLVFAGSSNFPGAAYLCCAAAYRAGAGLVTLVTEGSVKAIIAKKLPETTFLSSKESFKKLLEYDVYLLGPGLGQGKQATELTEQLLGNKGLKKAVIDGDGLNILSKMEKWWEQTNTEVVLTPHPGEMSRLTNLSIEKIQADRINVAQYYAKQWDKIIVLKGANTVIVSPTEKLLVSPFANPALATAGTGDVLAGIISAMTAQGLKSFDAACVGVYIHGLAGELLREKMGSRGVLASELLPLLPQVIKKLE